MTKVTNSKQILPYGQKMASKKIGDKDKASDVKKNDVVKGNPKQILGKDDFLKLLLTQLEHQDPTSPMETDKMLQQTSQLASLEASKNINKSLKNLTQATLLGQSFASLNAIGKMGELRDSTINHHKGKSDAIHIYFKKNVSSGNVYIKDLTGRVVKTIPVHNLEKGVSTFYWKGDTNDKKLADDAHYMVDASYKDYNKKSYHTSIGKYPIESVKFAKDDTLLKMGNKYISYKAIKAITNE